MKTWAQRIAEAEQAGGFSVDDVIKATNWYTCAVGEALGFNAAAVDEWGWARPPYGPGHEEGCRFTRAVNSNDFGTARVALAEVQAKLNESLIAATVKEAKRNAAQKELVSA